MNINRKNGSVLVVDDNEINRDMLQLRLEQAGFNALGASSGREALQKVVSSTPDLVLLDIMMPEMSGLEVLRKIRDRYSLPELPVIMATARDQSADIIEALDLGANDYVTKPFDFPVLLARVRTHLALHRLSKQKDEFLRIASHDLKNPLSVIRGFLKIAKSSLIASMPPTDVVELLNRADAQTRTMETIVSDYLDMQALEDGKLSLDLEYANPNVLCGKVVEQFLTMAKEKKITLLSRFDLNAQPIRFDEDRVRQVLENMIGNALKFSKSDTTIVVKTEADPESIRFEVVDNGPGLQDEDFPKLFTRNAKLSNKPTGGEKSSGLGLAISKDLIELHGGSLGAFNNAQTGATFWFSLPKESLGL